MEVVKKLAAQRMETAKELRAAQREAAQQASAIEESTTTDEIPDHNEYGELSKLLSSFAAGDKDDSGD